MSLFLKRQLYCCVMKSRCQKVFQRLGKKKKLRKIAQRLRSLTLPELPESPLQTLTLNVLSLRFNWRARSLGPPACVVSAHPPLSAAQARHKPGISSQQREISLSTTGSEQPVLPRGNREPDGKGSASQKRGARHNRAQQMRSGDARRAPGTGALPAAPPTRGSGQPPRQRSSSSSLLRERSGGRGRSQDSPTERKGLDPHRMYPSRLALASGSITGLHRRVTGSGFLRVFKLQNWVQVSCTILLEGRIAANCLSGVWPKCW